ncbi:MAG: gamma-glutamylcyclotransferase family protein [Pseudomonadota bacterium]
MDVFFYGLFMDRRVLEAQNFTPGNLRKARLRNFRILIGQRSTPVEDQGSVVYGVLADLPPDEVLTLYSDPSVSDYQPESVTLELTNGEEQIAICYILPEDKLTLGVDTDYAQKLHKLATALKFPADYLEEILIAGDSTARLD